MRTTFLDLYHFLRAPAPHRGKYTSRDKYTTIAYLLLITVVLGMILGETTDLLQEYRIIHDPGPNVNEEGGPLIFLLVVTIGPLVEEYIFRWQLLKVRAAIFYIFLTAATCLLSLTRWQIALPVSLLILISGLFTTLVRLTKLYQWWKNNFAFVFYFTSFSFAIMHLSNYAHGADEIPWSLLFVLPQVIGGITFGYCRIKLGLGAAVLLHTGCNLCFCTIDFLIN